MRKLTPAERAERLALEVEDPAVSDNLLEQITLRPDGYYWAPPDAKKDFGPFESLESALAAMGDDDQAPEPGETLQEAENEIGISDWIDPETGEPAEGQSHPRIDE